MENKHLVKINNVIDARSLFEKRKLKVLLTECQKDLRSKGMYESDSKLLKNHLFEKLEEAFALIVNFPD